jgi:hypothetical protein
MSAVHVFTRWARGAPQRRSVRLTAAVLALSIAVLAALLAHDVRSWRNTLRNDAMTYAISPTAPVQFTAPTYLPAGVSARLLAVNRDRRWLSALRFFARADALDPNLASRPGGQDLLHTTERALTLAAQDPNPARAAQAYSLLAPVLLTDSRASFTGDLTPYLVAITAMQNAVRVDPGNEQAAANLELLLRQFRTDVKRRTPLPANNQGPKKRRGVVGRGKGLPPTISGGGDY